MKYLIVILFSLFMNNECNQKNQDDTKLESIKYQATTRGYNYECLIDKDSIKVVSSGIKDGSSLGTIQEKDWEAFKTMIKELDLSKISNLEAPSAKSHTDRAAVGSLQIVVGGEVYESATFDDGNPPDELQPLLDKMVALAETVE